VLAVIGFPIFFIVGLLKIVQVVMVLKHWNKVH